MVGGVVRITDKLPDLRYPRLTTAVALILATFVTPFLYVYVYVKRLFARLRY